MVPYADFTYFALLLYVLLPVVCVGIWGRLSANWILASMGAMLVLQASGTVNLRPGVAVREIYLLLGYALYQGALAWAFLRWKRPGFFWPTLGLSILPLMASKVIPFLSTHTVFGFMGISYVTFRSLDVLFSIQDGLLKQIAWVPYGAYLLFLPTLSSGPVDRFRRFCQDWQKTRTRAEFLDDLEVAVQRMARGFWYKFVFAALIKTYWMDSVSTGRSFGTLWAYMYAYTFYLFFDFAGYSAFAVGIGRLLGIRVPENFDKPFLSRNIRDFWNRWHISLSFWFRDHVYMRFLLAASKAKWFKGKHTASYLGLFLTFGLMGLWHGLSRHYILYGLFHAALLSGYDWFARWNKEWQWWGSGRWQTGADILLTFHSIAFGLLLFSGRLTPPPPPATDFRVEKVTAHEVVGWMWERSAPDRPREVFLVLDEAIFACEKADLHREDLRDRGYGKGQCGFRFEMPWWVRDGRPHLVEVRDVLTGQPLPGYPQSLEFERNEEEIQREEAKMRSEQEEAAAAREKAEKEKAQKEKPQ
jgi:membrane protein involved in D-alanine export